MPAPLTFTEEGKTSRVWSRLFEERPSLAAKLSDPSLNITIENHEFGMPQGHFFDAGTKYPQLQEEFEVLNTAVDRKGVEYVATIEHKKYPFFGVQVRESLFFLLVLLFSAPQTAGERRAASRAFGWPFSRELEVDRKASKGTL